MSVDFLVILPYLIGGGFGGKELRSVAPYTAVAVAANKLIVIAFLTNELIFLPSECRHQFV